MQLLKFDEWQSGSGSWYVADVHTWTGWRAAAKVFNVEDVDSFITYLTINYDATVEYYDEAKDFLYFYWNKDNYKKAHKFKLDVNRIARKKDLQVEKKF